MRKDQDIGHDSRYFFNCFFVSFPLAETCKFNAPEHKIQ